MLMTRQQTNSGDKIGPNGRLGEIKQMLMTRQQTNSGDKIGPNGRLDTKTSEDGEDDCGNGIQKYLWEMLRSKQLLQRGIHNKAALGKLFENNSFTSDKTQQRELPPILLWISGIEIQDANFYAASSQ
ncbi:hypothetical protein QE152_g38097 [Popillia japonica]|uniref:Uncharacterized protein n=1 Tax=Popillia japonica TaxID=7064 RepID=A0AAW1I8D7_POPJA